MGEALYGLDDEMIACVITAIVFSIPTIYYRIKLKETEKRLARHIQTRWQWEECGGVKYASLNSLEILLLFAISVLTALIYCREYAMGKLELPPETQKDSLRSRSVEDLQTTCERLEPKSR